MNTYKTQFFAHCPTNNVRITYNLTIQTDSTIMVEDIIDEVSSLNRGFHEAFADRLHCEFGGKQTLTADHHGVIVETERP